MNKDEIFAHPNFPKYTKTTQDDWVLTDTPNGPELRWHLNKVTVCSTDYTRDRNGNLSAGATTITEKDCPGYYMSIRLDSYGNLIMQGFKPLV